MMIIQAEACIQDGDAAKFSVPGDDIAFFEVRKKSIQLKDEGLSSRAHGSHEPLKQKSRESSFFFGSKAITTSLNHSVINACLGNLLCHEPSVRHHQTCVQSTPEKETISYS